MKRHICMVTLLISVFTFIYIDEELGSNGVIGAIESVFGGGNNAEVTGNTNVIVGIPPVAGARE